MFYTNSSISNSRVLFVYRSSTASNPYACHAGLGINSLHSVKVLRKQGIRADLSSASQPSDLPPLLSRYSPTHCVIQAPWISGPSIASLLVDFSTVHFVVRCHSQVGFIQVEPSSIKIIRDLLIMQDNSLNLTVSANSDRMSNFLRRSYSARCLYLPNLYDLTPSQPPTWRPPTVRDVLKLASFGSLRLLKNHATAAAAALLVGQILNSKIEFYINVNREEHGRGVRQAIRNLFAGLRSATLVENPWETWPEFRRTVATMDLCFQLSMSETFNLVTADAAASCIPSVVSDAIEWTPRAWQVSPDDSETAAQRAVWLLSDREAGIAGRASLIDYNDRATRIWLDYLGSNPT